jgi:hypothetical protein
MSGLKPLGDPDALVCDGDVCALPTTAEASAQERPGGLTPDR